MRDRHHTKITFRKFPDGDVIALMPEICESRGYITSYMRVGQHGEASPDLMKDLDPATVEEWAPLKAELESIGYNVQVVP